MEKLLLSIDEAGAVAGIKRTKAYEFVRSGAWPSVHVGSLLRIPKSGLQAWIDEQARQAELRAAELREADAA